MSEAPKTVFVTRYALSGGIKEREVMAIYDDGYAYVKIPGGPSYGLQCGKGDWRATKAEAVARAEEMRLAKIASYEKSIAKLRKLSFD